MAYFRRFVLALMLLSLPISAQAPAASVGGPAGRQANSSDGTTPLHLAVLSNDLPAVQRLLQSGANPSAANRYGVTPLSLAAANGNAAIVEALLKAGADPKTNLPGGQTILMTAARSGNADAVKLLLVHGGDPNATENTNNETA